MEFARCGTFAHDSIRYRGRSHEEHAVYAGLTVAKARESIELHLPHSARDSPRPHRSRAPQRAQQATRKVFGIMGDTDDRDSLLGEEILNDGHLSS